MSINDLNNKLTDDVEAFKLYVQSNYQEGTNEPVSSEDLAEFGRQVYYALDSMKENLISYLRQK